MLRRCLVLMCLLLLAAGCGGDTPAADVASDAATGLALPKCGSPPSEDPNPPPAGAILPPTARMTAVRSEPPLTQLNAYVETTPAGVREWVEGQPDLEVVDSAETAGEVELLVSDGQWRTFVSARAVCADASLLAEVIAPHDSDATLPTPAGSP